MDATVKLPLDKITCKKQLYNMTTTGEILILNNCIKKDLDKHHVELEGVFYYEVDLLYLIFPEPVFEKPVSNNDAELPF